MNKDELKSILDDVAQGKISAEDAAVKFKTEPFEDLGFAKVDHHRGVRQGAAEVIYGAGKTKEQILKIVSAMLEHGEKSVLITRMSKEAYDYVSKEVPIFYDELSKVGIAGERLPNENKTERLL